MLELRRSFLQEEFLKNSKHGEMNDFDGPFSDDAVNQINRLYRVFWNP